MTTIYLLFQFLPSDIGTIAHLEVDSGVEEDQDEQRGGAGDDQIVPIGVEADVGGIFHQRSRPVVFQLTTVYLIQFKLISHQ